MTKAELTVIMGGVKTYVEKRVAEVTERQSTEILGLRELLRSQGEILRHKISELQRQVDGNKRHTSNLESRISKNGPTV